MAGGDYRTWVTQVTNLSAAVRELEPSATEMGLPAGSGMDWHGDLFQKLLPQLHHSPLLIVAVTGGTNTGKSVVFNHLVGTASSRTHPNATQTKHPVCSVPRGVSETENLSALFPDFQLAPWRSEDDALAEGPDNLLIVREDASGQQPQRLLLLDTPDVDGVLKHNWRRAELVRHAADVLICILTQQKYNDAAIREFFRAAAEADKTVLVVFNMLQWPRQRELIAGWLATFREETGIEPVHVYGVPWDHDLADANRLPFHGLSPGATNPRDDLAELQFDAIKIRSFRGSLRRVLDEQQGLPAFLEMMEGRGKEYAKARDILTTDLKVRIDDLPQLPRKLVWDEIWKWLDGRRTRFDRAINGFYSTLGSYVTRWFQKNPEEELPQFTAQEWDRLRAAVAEVLDRLDLLRRGGNEILQKVLGEALTGSERERLFADLKARHAAMPLVSEDYRRFIQTELDAFEREYPRLIKGISWTLVSTAVVRPVITVALFSVGAHGVDLAAGHLVAVAGDIVAGTAVAVTGEGLFAGARLHLRDLLTRLFAGYYQQRAKLLTETLHDRVLGPAIERLGRLAVVPESESFKEAQRILATLKAELA